MSQIHNNEFIFGESGGKGKHLLSFLKNLSLTGKQPPVSTDSDAYKRVNSDIYGSMAYGYTSPVQGGFPHADHVPQSSGRTVSGGARSGSAANGWGTSPKQAIYRTDSFSTLALPTPFSSSRNVTSENLSRQVSSSRPKYTDLDDDWDAQLEPTNSETDTSRPTQALNAPDISGMGMNFRHPASPAIVDPLSPDLMIVAPEARDSVDSQEMKANLEAQLASRLHLRFSKIAKILSDKSTINIGELRKLAWNGIPSELRAITWQLLLGYLPTNKARQHLTLKRKRNEYLNGLNNFNGSDIQGTSVSPDPNVNSSNRENTINKEKQLYHQINIDVKRTHPTIKLYSFPPTQTSLKKILYLWAVRHPASGYVQGINDLCTPFYQLFLQNYLWQLQRKHMHEFEKGPDDSYIFIPGYLDDSGTDEQERALYEGEDLHSLLWDTFDTGRLSQRVTNLIEADSYWCISRLLDNITDNYIHEQPGILKQVAELQTLIERIDRPLLEHLKSECVEFIQFSFRWMNCLLMREVSIELIIRMWDTYLSETPLGFSHFHVYVCAAFLIKFSAELKEKDFQDILLFLQNPPTAAWTEKDIELMLSEAFIWKSLYSGLH